MWLDGVALALLALFAVIGAWRGAFLAGAALATIVVGYGAAIVLGPVLAPFVADALGVSDMMALPVAGTLGFVLGYLSVVAFTAVLRRALSIDHEDPSARDRFLGGVFGLVRGGLVVVLVSWLALWIDALRVTGAEPPMPPIAGSSAAKIAGGVIEAGIEASLGEEATGRVVARVAARPGEALSRFETVFASPGLQAMRDDEMLWRLVENGNVDAALNRRSFLGVLYDDGLRSALGETGLVSPTAVSDPNGFRGEVALVLQQVGPRLKAIRNDPEILSLGEDPEIVALLQSGDTLALLRNPRFQRVVDRVISEPSPE